MACGMVFGVVKWFLWTVERLKRHVDCFDLRVKWLKQSVKRFVWYVACLYGV